MSTEQATVRVEIGVLERSVRQALGEAGADEPSAEAATRAVMHASGQGVDSHGVRLVPHYCRVLRGGRVNGRPQMRLDERSPVAITLDADDGLGHLAGYRAVEAATAAAARFGVGAVSVRRSSHFGAAGAYALAGAERGFLTIATSNSDSVVALHDGAAPFHGTNPFAAAAPVPDARPWLLDMATSNVPLNRVYLYRALGRTLSPDVAVDEDGEPTLDPNSARMLLPAGGEGFGFKGAALGGLMTILSAVLSGATSDPFVIPMDGEEAATPRDIGHFVLAISPDFFAGADRFGTELARYLDALRGSRPREGARVLAPGDREWEEAERRRCDGVPVDLATAEFLRVG